MAMCFRFHVLRLSLNVGFRIRRSRTKFRESLAGQVGRRESQEHHRGYWYDPCEVHPKSAHGRYRSEIGYEMKVGGIQTCVCFSNLDRFSSMLFATLAAS